MASNTATPSDAAVVLLIGFLWLHCPDISNNPLLKLLISKIVSILQNQIKAEKLNRTKHCVKEKVLCNTTVYPKRVQRLGGDFFNQKNDYSYIRKKNLSRKLGLLKRN